MACQSYPMLFAIKKMIKTKSILLKREPEDGVRVCVMRFVKVFYVYDVWKEVLAPSKNLLYYYRNKKITWDIFNSRYKQEMMTSKFSVEEIKKLKELSSTGQIITLLCWEREDKYCHRRILKGLIDNYRGINNAS